MQYLTKINKTYYYYRRVPASLKDYDPRPFIRLSLHTDSASQAAKLAHARNQEIEAYWHRLKESCTLHSLDKFKAAVAAARSFGFGYYPASEIANFPLSEIFVRLDTIAKNIKAPKQVEAVAGGVAKPIVKLKDCLPKYFEFSKNLIMNKTSDQTRKWKNPRIKAMRNFINVVGNKPINELTRDDTLKVRDALILRVQEGKILPVSANKEIVFAKTIIGSISDNLNLELNITHLFRKLILDEDDEGGRLPFETDYIINILLNEQNLLGLNEEAKNALYALAETGAGFSELTGLLPENIILDHEIPHIDIKRREKHRLKTKFRVRKIPLVGYALDAFKAFPNGFTSYFEKPDSLSTVINKYLSENNLLPSSQHSAYSLRHSLQDRMTRSSVPLRVQTDIMGHKPFGEGYGEGSDLNQKLEELKKIQLKHE